MLRMNEASEVRCFTCTATPHNILKCTKPEYLGTYKKCPEGFGCFKSVNRETGEVNKGCATAENSKEQRAEEDKSQKIFLCSASLCNGSGKMVNSLI